MRRRLLLLSLFLASTSYALPPGERDRGFRDGANHHLGDDSFVVRFGHAPRRADDEATRMHVHLAYVHELLAARAPTRPELAATRTRLLGYLAEYITAGTTPINSYVPWRSPVFIDAAGNICAVGYLIERSAGRDLAETIARDHRLEFLEDIAAAMPQVDGWIASSGFTLEELASIQPGYNGPDVQHVEGWLLMAEDGQPIPIEDGTFERKDGVGTLTGRFANQRMTGKWTRVAGEGKVIGAGVFTRGAGRWRSTFLDGTRMAEGAYANNLPQGRWRFFHPSGRIAAEGSFAKGRRHGAWRFFHDTKQATPIAAGRFAHGAVAGTWRHFDQAGKLLASARHAPERSSGSDGGRYADGLLLSITPGTNDVTHEVHEGIPAEDVRLDGFYLGNERIYQQEDGTIYDATGSQLEHAGGTWQSSDCRWSRARKRAASAGDITTVHVLLLRDAHAECSNPRPVAAARAKRIEMMLATLGTVRSPTPAFVRAYLGDSDGSYDRRRDGDLASVLAAHMTWYMEWPHIDELFVAVYGTLPGYTERLTD